MSANERRAWTFRMPEAVLDWLREQAAHRSVREKRHVSINTIAIETLKAAKEASHDRDHR
ncbi:MAG: hypothetical protein JRI34_00885 [Deltaproteobacteria bacterium]|nr:hypothetical protein [Deltaproteobacteria bacterium]